MRRQLLLVPLVMACGPAPEDFARLYQARFCDAFVEDCGDPLPEICREQGFAPASRAPSADCDYRSEPARLCVIDAVWTCTDGVVEPPAACANVWSCPAQ